MILSGMSITRIALGVLYVSIAIIILYILYKKLLRYMNRDVLEKAHYCELNSLEKDPAHGELEFWFTSQDTKLVTFEILDKDYAPLEVISEKEYGAGQHIVRYDSTKLANGTYFYQLRTDNQQIIKKMVILN